MWTATLFAGSTLIWWTRSWRTTGASRSTWTRPLKNWLPANHALWTLSWPALTLHGPCAWGSLHWSALWGAGRGGARRRRCIYRTRARLRRNHSSLLHNRLARYWLCRRGRSGSRLLACFCRWWRCRRFLHCCRWWRNHYCWRMCRRRNHYCGWSGGLFNWRRRNHCRRRRLDHRRCNHSTSFRCRSSRFCNHNGRLFCRWRSCRRRRSFHWCRRSSGRSGNNRRFGRRSGRMMLLLLSLSEQPCYVARFGNLREVDLRFDLCRGRSLPRRRAGSGRKMLSYPYRFIFLDRA